MDSTPVVFANKVINQFIQHLLGSDMEVRPEDYLAIRVTYRNQGGSWADFAAGSKKQMDLLKVIVTAWGQMPQRRKVQLV